jgi:hypothetical protein
MSEVNWGVVSLAVDAVLFVAILVLIVTKENKR